ncbi:MAG: SpoIIE family protein phosphatase [Clostridia bacterium]|nr:SpoIIE family protein phosphatase [Clostridia bacterium]
MDLRAKAKEKLETLQQKADKTVGALMGRPAELLDEEDAARLRRRAGITALWCVTGFIFQGTTALFSSRPFGIAMLLASGRSGAVAVFAGAVAGALASGQGGLAQAVILGMVLGARLLFSARVAGEEDEPLPLFGEPLHLRAAVAVFAAFLAGVYNVVVYEFHFRGVMALLFGLAAAPLLTALFWLGLQKDKPISLREVGACVLLFCGIYALAGHSLFGLSPALIAACLATMQSALKGGLLRGGLVGLICGVACGTSPLLLAAGGLVAGSLRMFGAGSAVFCFFAVTGGLSVWQDGIWGALPVLGNLLFGVLLFLPLARSGLLGKLSLFPAAETEEPTCEADRRAADAVRLRRLSASFDDLSKMLLKFSQDLARPETGEMLELCEGVFRRYCKKCVRSERCWQDEYESTRDALCKLAEEIPRCGMPRRNALPPYFTERCRKIDEILAEIGVRVAEHVENVVLRDRSELFALDYQALAELLRESAVDDGSLTPDEELRKTFATVIRGEGIQTVGCGAWGTRKKLLIASGVTLSTIPGGGRALRHKLEEKTGLALTEPSFKFVGESVSMQFESRQRFRLTTARACSVKEHEPVSGDTARSFTSEAGQGYALVCDGMGSGRAAASAAGVSALFLEKLLSGGNHKSVTLKLLSNFIRGRAEECHCTVDLLEVDLYTGGAAFVKCGACPSYVLRQGNIYKIDVHSMPLGLTREINAQQVNMVLQEGDVILQVSDGVAGTLEEALWLPEVFASLSGKSVQEIAGAIHSRTIAEKGRGDDITVLVTKVEAA